MFNCAIASSLKEPDIILPCAISSFFSEFKLLKIGTILISIKELQLVYFDEL